MKGWLKQLFCKHEYEELIHIPVLVNGGCELKHLTLQHCKKCGKRGLFCKDSAYRALMTGRGENEVFLREVIDKWLQHEMTAGNMISLMCSRFPNEDPIAISESNRVRWRFKGTEMIDL